MNVSIIIPAYCPSDESVVWLEECLVSACKQNCSVVVYNDGSPRDICKVAGKFSVKFVDANGNRGVSYARNRAIEFAETDCILPLDCDDRIVDHAVEQLYDMFMHGDRVPVYPDVSKFGNENDPHYQLLDFSCEHIYNYVGFTSVNVLHGKEQWKSVGGYDESLKFYEDGEYNARLFAKYCGVHHRQPLIEYRIHDNQRTKQFESESRKYALTILEKIRRIDMACPGCGKRRSQGNLPSGVNQNVVNQMVARVPVSEETTKVMISNVPTNLPLVFDNRVLVVYIGGKGRAKHYCQGIATKTPYKVTYGDYVYVDPRDARENDDQISRSLFVKVKAPTPPPAPPAVVEVVRKQEPVTAVVEVVEKSLAEGPVRTPRVSIDKNPVEKRVKK